MFLSSAAAQKIQLSVIGTSWTAIERGSVLKLEFRLKIHNDLKEKEDKYITAPFEVDDFAQVRFKFALILSTPDIERGVSINVSTKLSDYILRKNQGHTVVHLNVTCEELGFFKEWDCSEQWSGWIHIGTLESVTDDIRNPTEDLEPFELTMTVSKKETITFDKLFDDTGITDFKLSTAEGSVSLHKVLLAAHSSVFKTMFKRECMETTDGNVQIQGVTLRTLKDLKKYIYMNSLPDYIEELRSLLVLASHYMMEILMSECITKVMKKVTSENLQILLEHACAHNIPELTFAIIEQTPSEVVHQARLNRKAKEAKEDFTEQKSPFSLCKSIDGKEL